MTDARDNQSVGVPNVASSGRAASLALAALAICFCSCTLLLRPIRDGISPPGKMNADGSINPCHFYERRHQACGDAIWNAKQIHQVSLGQTKEAVREIMRHEPERRSALIDEQGRAVESWGYLVDYRGRLVTRITFTDGIVTKFEQEAWE